MIKERNIVVCILFTIITCGLYGIYWIAVVQNDSLKAAEEEGVSGALVVLFTIITCGIYGFIWAYQLGCRVDRLNSKQGQGSSSMGIIFLVLSLFGLSIVNNCFAQIAINRYSNPHA